MAVSHSMHLPTSDNECNAYTYISSLFIIIHDNRKRAIVIVLSCCVITREQGTTESQSATPK